MKPALAATRLRSLAAQIQASQAPDRLAAAQAVRKILAQVEEEETQGGPWPAVLTDENSFSKVPLDWKMMDLFDWESHLRHEPGNAVILKRETKSPVVVISGADSSILYAQEMDALGANPGESEPDDWEGPYDDVGDIVAAFY